MKYFFFLIFLLCWQSPLQAQWSHGQGNGFSGFHEDLLNHFDALGLQPNNFLGPHSIVKDLLRLVSNRSMENPAHAKDTWQRMIQFARGYEDQIWKAAARLTPPVTGRESCMELLVKAFIFDKGAVAHATLVNRWAGHIKAFDPTYGSTTEILAGLVDHVKQSRSLALTYANESRAAMEIFAKKCSHFRDPNQVVRFVNRLMDVATRALEIYDAGEMEIKHFDPIELPPPTLPPPPIDLEPPPKEMAAPLTALGALGIIFYWAAAQFGF